MRIAKLRKNTQGAKKQKTDITKGSVLHISKDVFRKNLVCAHNYSGSPEIVRLTLEYVISPEKAKQLMGNKKNLLITTIDGPIKEEYEYRLKKRKTLLKSDGELIARIYSTLICKDFAEDKWRVKESRVELAPEANAKRLKTSKH